MIRLAGVSLNLLPPVQGPSDSCEVSAQMAPVVDCGWVAEPASQGQGEDIAGDHHGNNGPSGSRKGLLPIIREEGGVEILTIRASVSW